MIKARIESHRIFKGVLFFIGAIFSLLCLQACQNRQETDQDLLNTATGSNTQTLLPVSEVSVTLTTPAEPTVTNTPQDDYQPVWDDFPPPNIEPVTPIPAPQDSLIMPDEVIVWVLLGSDEEPPFIGRTPAIHLLFIHPRFSKASLVSIPGNLFVYIPGYTMQRINTAYALGGIETLRQTLAYNFGVTPSRFVLAHPGDFQWLVDDINRIEVTVFYPMPQACGGIRAGVIEMDGTMALCYASYLEDFDEIDRMRRQQQLLRVIFQKLTRDGNLSKLPVLYASFEDWVKTDISLVELLGYIPLALRLADSDRIGYYMIGWEQLSIWEIPGYSQAKVFIPDEKDVKMVLEDAVKRILTPEPLTDRVSTLEAQLTSAYQATAAPGEPLETTPSPMQSITSTVITPGFTQTPSPSSTTVVSTPLATATPQGYP